MCNHYIWFLRHALILRNYKIPFPLMQYSEFNFYILYKIYFSLATSIESGALHDNELYPVSALSGAVCFTEYIVMDW